MAKMRNPINKSICVFGLVAFLAACSTIPILKVTYRLPPQPEKPIGGEIWLRVEDNRVSQDMIGKGARDDFERFTGTLWLHLAEKEGEGTRLGAYDLKSMFQEAFKNRLARSGVKVAPEAGADQACLFIKLNTFLLDLVGIFKTLRD